VEEARRAILTAQAKIAFARTAVEASESVRAIRTARHREGLLPLLEVLDAESGLAGARTLLLASQLERRLGQAQLALALGQPIENVKE
jgi:outer membrane protein TolC